jgi:hypothetical protein
MTMNEKEYELAKQRKTSGAIFFGLLHLAGIDMEQVATVVSPINVILVRPAQDPEDDSTTDTMFARLVEMNTFLQMLDEDKTYVDMHIYVDVEMEDGTDKILGTCGSVEHLGGLLTELYNRVEVIDEDGVPKASVDIDGLEFHRKE